MDELIFDDLQPEEELASGEDICLATIASVTGTGVTIKIDGETAAGAKEYKVNAGVLFAAGDRVKIHKNSGTFIIEYPIGAPMSRYPIPSGGSDGQYLVKDGATNYAVKWKTLSVHGIPSGGSKNEVLLKSSGTDYAVEWGSVAIPAGGTTGQVLTKQSASNYDVKWATVTISNGLPSGGTAGQYLTKVNATDYNVQWSSAPSVSQLVNGNYTLNLSSAGVLSSNSTSKTVALGSSNYPFVNMYVKGNLYLGTTTSDKIGFFGHAVAARQTVSNSATVATLITALKAYGLIA